MFMFHADRLMKRPNVFIDPVVESGIYKHWSFLIMNHHKIKPQNMAIDHTLDGYYSFNLYHIQPAFYLLLMGLCLSVLCFVIEVLCDRVLSKRK
jgi:hypothetical protein